MNNQLVVRVVVVIVSALSISLLACNKSEGASCSDHWQCEGDLLCLLGTCETPGSDPEEAPKESSSSSSGSAAPDCSKAWSSTCEYDQATSVCQQACTYEGDDAKHKQVCDVLNSMTENDPNGCCQGCK